MGSLIVLAAALFAVSEEELDGGLVGLSISYALQVNTGINPCQFLFHFRRHFHLECLLKV